MIISIVLNNRDSLIFLSYNKIYSLQEIYDITMLTFGIKNLNALISKSMSSRKFLRPSPNLSTIEKQITGMKFIGVPLLLLFT